MCEIYLDRPSTTTTGYKLAFKSNNGKYYSIVTNMEYKVGQIEGIPTREIAFKNEELPLKCSPTSNNVLCKEYRFYNKSFFGYTMCFDDIDSRAMLYLKELILDYISDKDLDGKLITLEITFKEGTVFESRSNILSYTDKDAISGSFINSIKEL